MLKLSSLGRQTHVPVVSSIVLAVLLAAGCGHNTQDGSYQDQRSGRAAALDAVPPPSALDAAPPSAFDAAPSSALDAAPNDRLIVAKKVLPNQNPSQSQTPTQAPMQPVGPLTITGLGYAGNACPQGSIASNVSPDGKAFTLIFSQYEVSLDANAKHRSMVATKGCNVDVMLAVPQGMQVTVLSLDIRGFANLPSTARATLTTSVAVKGATTGRPVRFVGRVNGAYDGDFQIHHDANLRTTSWSKCGSPAHLRIGVGTRLESHQGESALIAIDSLDGELKHQYGLALRRCP